MSSEPDASPPGRAAAQSGQSIYKESLRTPWWWYPVALFVASLLAAEFHIAGYTLTDWIPFSTLLPLSVIIVWSLGRGTLIISADDLSIRGARLPLRYVGATVSLDARTLRRLIGRFGDPRAFVSIRPWIGPGVQVQLDDPDDPTPYWVISTRRPEHVAALLRAHRA